MMDSSILYRLVLARTFLSNAEANLHRGDPNSVALAIVSSHDAVDNVLGAIASHLNIPLQDDCSLLRTYDKIGSSGQSLGSRTKLAQLNAIRNNVKHQGLHPNPTIARTLIPEIVGFCSDRCVQYFGKRLVEIHVVDAIADTAIRGDMQHIERQIAEGDYRDALERLALVIFEIYEKRIISWKRMVERHLARLQGRDMPEPEWEFPEIDPTDKRLDFIELGIDPAEYERFHFLVPQVGRRPGSKSDFVLKKTRHLWHAANWTSENAQFAFDLVLRIIMAKQHRSASDNLVRQHPVDRITVFHDTDLYSFDKKTILRHLPTQSKLYAVALPYVDGAWQNFGEELVCANFYDGTDWTYGCLLKSDIEIELDIRTDEVAASDGERNWGET